MKTEDAPFELVDGRTKQAKGADAKPRPRENQVAPPGPFELVDGRTKQVRQ